MLVALTLIRLAGLFRTPAPAAGCGEDIGNRLPADGHQLDRPGVNQAVQAPVAMLPAQQDNRLARTVFGAVVIGDTDEDLLVEAAEGAHHGGGKLGDQAGVAQESG